MDEIEIKARNLKIKDFYRKEYSTDELGNELNDTVTFYDLFVTLDTYKNVYDLIGVSDSMVRERLFIKLAEIMEIPYKEVYDQWLLAD